MAKEKKAYYNEIPSLLTLKFPDVNIYATNHTVVKGGRRKTNPQDRKFLPYGESTATDIARSGLRDTGKRKKKRRESKPQCNVGRDRKKFRRTDNLPEGESFTIDKAHSGLQLGENKRKKRCESEPQDNVGRDRKKSRRADNLSEGALATIDKERRGFQLREKSRKKRYESEPRYNVRRDGKKAKSVEDLPFGELAASDKSRSRSEFKGKTRETLPEREPRRDIVRYRREPRGTYLHWRLDRKARKEQHLESDPLLVPDKSDYIPLGVCNVENESHSVPSLSSSSFYRCKFADHLRKTRLQLGPGTESFEKFPVGTVEQQKKLVVRYCGGSKTADSTQVTSSIDINSPSNSLPLNVCELLGEKEEKIAEGIASASAGKTRGEENAGTELLQELIALEPDNDVSSTANVEIGSQSREQSSCTAEKDRSLKYDCKSCQDRLNALESRLSHLETLCKRTRKHRKSEDRTTGDELSDSDDEIQLLEEFTTKYITDDIIVDFHIKPEKVVETAPPKNTKKKKCDLIEENRTTPLVSSTENDPASSMEENCNAEPRTAVRKNLLKFECDPIDPEELVKVFTCGVMSETGSSGIGIWFGEGHSLNVSYPINDVKLLSNRTLSLQAVWIAVQIAKSSGLMRIMLHTTSSQVIKCIRKLNIYKQRNWRNKAGELMKNRMQIKQLRKAISSLCIEWKMVPPHRIVLGAEKARQLALAAVSESPARI